LRKYESIDNSWEEDKEAPREFCFLDRAHRGRAWS
jgi:hypothetical protein